MVKLTGKFKLSLAAAIIILAGSLWLTWSVQIWGSVSQLLQGIAVFIIIWALLNEKTSKPLAFFFNGFLVSYLLTSAIWFTTLAIAAGYFLPSLGPVIFIYSLAYVILPRSLLPIAISAVVYGITKTKLKPWEILISAWYMSIFAVRAAYEVWWIIFVQPYLQDFYTSGAGAMALDIFLIFLAFLVACIFSFAYLALKKPLDKLSNGHEARVFCNQLEIPIVLAFSQLVS